VTYGVRDPHSEKTQQALAATRRGRSASPTEAVQNAKVVVVALRWDAVNEMVKQLPSRMARS
jgi:predicted dinucleotide-binding enzyme